MAELEFRRIDKHTIDVYDGQEFLGFIGAEDGCVEFTICIEPKETRCSGANPNGFMFKWPSSFTTDSLSAMKEFLQKGYYG